ncbi:MAG: hypothetical protein A3D33_06160 [Candidatus Rokubacteria bacterium RIFCSPHIGHO2_02_FULL_73_26]|nr:MAG: hypothetical protein A3D33_06160 [Candidatus Rokubacteria bacterium RIFCSPHIGHO2_02_FULL_73_26]
MRSCSVTAAVSVRVSSWPMIVREISRRSESWVTRSDCSAASRRAASSRSRVFVESCRISSTSLATWLRAPRSVWRRRTARRTTSSMSCRENGLIRYSNAPWVSASFTVSREA